MTENSLNINTQGNLFGVAGSNYGILNITIESLLVAASLAAGKPDEQGEISEQKLYNLLDVIKQYNPQMESKMREASKQPFDGDKIQDWVDSAVEANETVKKAIHDLATEVKNNPPQNLGKIAEMIARALKGYEPHERVFCHEEKIKSMSQEEANRYCRECYAKLKATGDLGRINPHFVNHVWANITHGDCIANITELSIRTILNWLRGYW